MAFSALCQASHVYKPAAPPPLSNLVAISRQSRHQSFNRCAVACLLMKYIIGSYVYDASLRAVNWIRAHVRAGEQKPIGCLDRI